MARLLSPQSMQMETLGRPSVGVRDGSILMPQHSGSMVSAQSRSGKGNINLMRINYIANVLQLKKNT